FVYNPSLQADVALSKRHRFFSRCSNNIYKQVVYTGHQRQKYGNTFAGNLVIYCIEIHHMGGITTLFQMNPFNLKSK
ncbi:hypothetical protein KKA14_05530, partial [bacterium]|nr:hypothetical protein [bacterium]